MALRSVRYLPVGAAMFRRANVLIYRLGGLVIPFIGIKLIDLRLVVCGLAEEGQGTASRQHV